MVLSVKTLGHKAVSTRLYCCRQRGCIPATKVAVQRSNLFLQPCNVGLLLYYLLLQLILGLLVALLLCTRLQ